MRQYGKKWIDLSENLAMVYLYFLSTALISLDTKKRIFRLQPT